MDGLPKYINLEDFVDFWVLLHKECSTYFMLIACLSDEVEFGLVC